ncbi:hypothetical protein PVMG_05634 [Plasmodium vivax Mauritania I]|uniref:PIR Superfamily Protein n=1 Tax=Plasmodium vivax Mauritania I TaxID=1035515 RepID=A0A0J9TH74_PLAVI|nr:hypothetical protein PVMG_05634 [Plasmodium vivax Mauritania I]
MMDINHERCCVETENYLNSIGQRKKEALKNIGCSVECGYHYLTVFNDKRLTDLCMYLNLWLDEQKSTHINGIFVITEAEWNLIEKLWNDLNHKQHSNRKCERQPEKKNIFEYSKRKELMTYCINRDYFKSLFKSSSGSEYFLSQRCKGFSDYTSKYYVELVSGIDYIDKKSDIEDYKYHISDDCTLYDIPKTFPICEAHTPTIVYDDNSKANIICKTTAEKVLPIIFLKQLIITVNIQKYLMVRLNFLTELMILLNLVNLIINYHLHCLQLIIGLQNLSTMLGCQH